MIVNHTTGEQITLRALRLARSSICTAENPLLSQPGYRTAWADEASPTDAELRLIGHSLLVNVAQPTPGAGEQVREGTPEKVGDEWRQTWIVELIPVVVPYRVESHKIKIELTRNGLRGPVTQLINSADQDVKDAWTAPYFHRNSPFIGQFASLLGLTNEEVDQIFINANNRMT